MFKITSKVAVTLVLAIIMSLLMVTVSYAGSDSVYLSPIGVSQSDIVMSDWQPVQAANATYWATQNWNQGAEGGGYAGFQMGPPTRTHFAIWDPVGSSDPLTAVYAIKGANVSRFGGEGTGLKCMYEYPWQVG